MNVYVYKGNLLCAGCAALAVHDAIRHQTETAPVSIPAAVAIITHGLAGAAKVVEQSWLPDMLPVAIPDHTAEVHDTCAHCQAPLHDPVADGEARQ